MKDKDPKREPDRVCIDKYDRDLYNKIKEEDIFSGKTAKELFLAAMAFGFKNNTRRPLKNREASGYLRTEYLSIEDRALIYAVALQEAHSEDVLSDKEEVFSIAEEFAHGGIRILHDAITSVQLGSFDKQFEKMLHESYEELMKQGL